MMDVIHFLRARINEDEAVALALPHGHAGSRARGRRERALAEVAAKRAALEVYEAWPVLTRTEPVFEQEVDPSKTISDVVDSIVYRSSQQIEWLTTQSYIDRFGSEPPVAPFIRAIVRIYADHPDCREEWL